LLGRMREARAVPALIAAVAAWGDHDPYVLSAAVKSLGLIGDKRAVPVLRALLAGPGVSFMARVEAAYALAAIGGEDAWAALEEAAARDSNERVRRAASDAAAKGVYRSQYMADVQDLYSRGTNCRWRICSLLLSLAH
jgi:HEAT repeat protein